MRDLQPGFGGSPRFVNDRLYWRFLYRAQAYILSRLDCRQIGLRLLSQTPWEVGGPVADHLAPQRIRNARIVYSAHSNSTLLDFILIIVSENAIRVLE